MRIHPIDYLIYCLLKVVKQFDNRKTDLKYFNPDDVKNILVISSTAIGDTLLSTPAIKAIRKRYPEAKIIAMFNKKYMELFENNPHIDGVIPYYGGYKKFCKTIKNLRRYKFDVVVILHGNEPQATPMAYLSGAKYIIKVPIPERYAFLLSNKSNGFRNPWSHHAINVRLKAASFIDCREADKKMVLVVEKEEEEFIDFFLKKIGIKKDNILIGFQPGAATRHKTWPKENFIELGKRLIQYNKDIRILITGSENERNLCKFIVKGIGKSAFSVAGKISLKHLRALINKLNLLITNDTGTMHIAIALRTRTISLFCPTNYWGVGPIQDRNLHKIIFKERPCNPCVSKKCKDAFCMKQITVDEVFHAIKEIFDENCLL